MTGDWRLFYALKSKGYFEIIGTDIANRTPSKPPLLHEIEDRLYLRTMLLTMVLINDLYKTSIRHLTQNVCKYIC